MGSVVTKESNHSRYSEETSEWTLDYPPLFAWFERLLAYPAAFLDPAMLHISKLPYTSPECILFQVEAQGCYWLFCMMPFEEQLLARHRLHGMYVAALCHAPQCLTQTP